MARRLPPFVLALAATVVMLAARPAGAAAPPNPPNDEKFGAQVALKAIKAPEAWATSTGEGVKVAVVSTGIADHPDLAGKTGAGFDPTGGAGTDDIEGRGTHLAGIVGAATNNGQGIAGVAPDAQVLPIKAFESAESFDDPDVDAYFQALDRAGTAASVVLVDVPEDFPAARKAELAQKLRSIGVRGVSVVIGAQSGLTLGNVPVLVAASSTSQAGASGVVAPGNVLSTTVTSARVPVAGSTTYDYDEQSGNNRSAALVAGAVAILRGAGASSGVSADVLRRTKSADTGTIDVVAALNAYKPPPPPPPPSTTTTTKKAAAAPATTPGTTAGPVPSGLSDTAGFTGPAEPAEPVEPGEGEEAIQPPGAEELLEMAESGGAGSSQDEDDRPLGMLAVGFGMLCGAGSALSLTFRRLAGPPL